ncbi:hypothetical protein JZO70_21475 [Enterococcus sp. 669A]|uniref:Uncharacterized protein n=1 Tax=Candidatus Enterococcus moelleringii TaxID=2815325 RepID=A0ABS3LGJ6_9ENTE|nr:hypothetical protein [Enterococcus sp. 669A]MBO1308757.1 hypothetical protein [Enterococcus sp. 669A]
MLGNLRVIPKRYHPFYLGFMLLLAIFLVTTIFTGSPLILTLPFYAFAVLIEAFFLSKAEFVPRKVIFSDILFFIMCFVLAVAYAR